MSARRCQSCGMDTLAFEGWSRVDHCAHCGKVLDDAEIEPLVTKAKTLAHQLAPANGRVRSTSLRRPPKALEGGAAER